MKNKTFNKLIIIFAIMIFFSALFLLFINQKPNVSLTVESNYLSLVEGEDGKINYQLENGEEENLQFVSSDTTIATVTNDGKVTGIGEGYCEITITYDELKVIVIVTVQEKIVQNHELNIKCVLESDSMYMWKTSDVKLNISVISDDPLVSVKYAINCQDNCDYQEIEKNSTIDFQKDGEYEVEILASDSYGNEKIENISFKIDKSKPTITYSLDKASYDSEQMLNIQVLPSISGINKAQVTVYEGNDLYKEYSDLSEAVNIKLTDGLWKITTVVSQNNGLSSSVYKEYVINDKGYVIGPGGEQYTRTITYLGRTFRDYKQQRFNLPFSNQGTIKDNGCGAISLVNVLSGYMDVKVDEVAAYMKYGTFKHIRETATHYGLKDGGILYYNSNYPDQKTLNSIKESALKHLKSGGQLIALVSNNTKCYQLGCNPSKFAGENHFMAIIGVKKDDTLLILNPSEPRSEEGTLDEIMQYYMPSGGKGFLFLSK